MTRITSFDSCECRKPVLDQISKDACSAWYDVLFEQNTMNPNFPTHLKILRQIIKNRKIDCTDALFDFIVDGIYPDTPDKNIAKDNFRATIIEAIAEYVNRDKSIDINAMFYEALNQLL